MIPKGSGESFSGCFVALNGWLGIQFLLWCALLRARRHGAKRAKTRRGRRLAAIAGLMNTKYFFLIGRVPAIHPAAMVLFIAFMLMSLLLKKAFCSWLCPVGTLSEQLWKLGRAYRPQSASAKMGGYSHYEVEVLLLGFFVFLIGAMSAEAIHDSCPHRTAWSPMSRC